MLRRRSASRYGKNAFDERSRIATSDNFFPEAAIIPFNAASGLGPAANLAALEALDIAAVFLERVDDPLFSRTTRLGDGPHLLLGLGGFLDLFLAGFPFSALQGVGRELCIDPGLLSGGGGVETGLFSGCGGFFAGRFDAFFLAVGDFAGL